MENNEEFWKPYDDYVSNTLLSYKTIWRDLVEGFPLMIAEQSKTNRVALLILPTHDGMTLSGDLIKSTEFARNTFLRLVTEAKKSLASKAMDIPLLVCQVRLVYTPKTEKKQLALNKQWLI